MISPLEQVIAQMSKTEHHLMYHLIMEQKETNRLLQKLAGESSEIVEEVEQLKRPELMKRIAKLENKPQGWNTWGTEQMRKYLKEAS